MKFKLIASYEITFYLFYYSALHIAVNNNNMKMVKILLSNTKIDVNIPFV